MKKLRLNGVRPPMDPASPMKAHHFYTVHLGNRRTLLFASERAAQAFQAETDRWISSVLLDANFLMTECWVAYRAAWWLLDETKLPGNVDQQARELAESAWRDMDLALAKCQGPSGWLLGWRFVAGALQAVANLAALLAELHRSRNHPVERARAELILQRANSAIEHMQTYGSTAKGAVKTMEL